MGHNKVQASPAFFWVRNDGYAPRSHDAFVIHTPVAGHRTRDQFQRPVNDEGRSRVGSDEVQLLARFGAMEVEHWRGARLVAEIERQRIGMAVRVGKGQMTYLAPRADFLHLFDPDNLAIFSSHGR